MEFLTENWADLAGIVLLLSTLIIVKPSLRMPVIERTAYIKRLLQNLMPIALLIVYEADKTYTTHERLKRSYIIDALYLRIPEDYRCYITIDNLDMIIDNARDELAKSLENQTL